MELFHRDYDIGRSNDYIQPKTPAMDSDKGKFVLIFMM
jgi:hypothetical protein